MPSTDDDGEVTAGSKATAADDEGIITVTNASAGVAAVCVTTNTAPEALPLRPSSPPSINIRAPNNMM